MESERRRSHTFKPGFCILLGGGGSAVSRSLTGDCISCLFAANGCVWSAVSLRAGTQWSSSECSELGVSASLVAVHECIHEKMKDGKEITTMPTPSPSLAPSPLPSGTGPFFCRFRTGQFVLRAGAVFVQNGSHVFRTGPVLPGTWACVSEREPFCFRTGPFFQHKQQHQYITTAATTTTILAQVFGCFTRPPARAALGLSACGASARGVAESAAVRRPASSGPNGHGPH